MPLTVERHGGIMAMAPRIRSIDVATLDDAARQALADLVRSGGEAPAGPRQPDAFVYVFKIDDPALGTGQVAVAGSNVPPALRRLLP